MSVVCPEVSVSVRGKGSGGVRREQGGVVLGCPDPVDSSGSMVKD